MTHKISCCSTLCRFMLKIVFTKKRVTKSKTKWIIEFNFTTKRFVQITHGNIVASHSLVLATPRFELNWVSKACVSIFPSTHEVCGAHSADQCAAAAWSVGGYRLDSRVELKTDLFLFCSAFASKTQNKTKQHSKNLVKSSCAKKIVDLTIYRLTRKFNEDFFKTWTHFNPCILNQNCVNSLSHLLYSSTSIVQRL